MYTSLDLVRIMAVVEPCQCSISNTVSFRSGATFSALCGLFPFLISAGVFAFLFPAVCTLSFRLSPSGELM
jgi:hypothetical protein